MKHLAVFLLAVSLFAPTAEEAAQAWELSVKLPEKSVVTRQDGFVRIESMDDEKYIIIIRKRAATKKEYIRQTIESFLDRVGKPEYTMIRENNDETLACWQSKKDSLSTRVWIYRVNSDFYTIWTTWKTGELDVFFMNEFFRKS